MRAVGRHGLALALMAFITSSVFAGAVDIVYTVTPLNEGRWVYTYDITNNALILRVKAFTIWFDLGSCAQLAVVTPDPLSGVWRETIAQPDPLLKSDGFYDVRTLSDGIEIGQTEHGFSVAFDWRGTGQPGAQRFTIIDPLTWDTEATGTTLPEPAGLGLLAMLLVLRRQRR